MLVLDSEGFNRLFLPVRNFFKLNSVKAWIAAAAAPLAIAAAHAADAPAIPDFAFNTPLPAVVAAAQAAGVPIQGIELGGDRTASMPGDFITVLVSLGDESDLRQWLVRLDVDDFDEKDRDQAPKSSMRLYSSTGAQFDYAGVSVPIGIRIIGPFTGAADIHKAARGADDKKARVLVNSEYLSLGFDRACAAFLRIHQAMAAQGLQPEPLSLSSGPEAPPPARAQANREALRAAGLTPEDEKAFLGTVLALREFFRIARRTPGLQEIMLSVINLPIWEIITHPGKVPELLFDFQPGFRAIDPSPWNLPAGSNAYALAFVLDLDQKPSLSCQLAVTAPRPPLASCAGIVGMAAQRPDGKGPLLTIQILAAGHSPSG